MLTRAPSSPGGQSPPIAADAAAAAAAAATASVSRLLGGRCRPASRTNSCPARRHSAQPEHAPAPLHVWKCACVCARGVHTWYAAAATPNAMSFSSSGLQLSGGPSDWPSVWRELGGARIKGVCACCALPGLRGGAGSPGARGAIGQLQAGGARLRCGARWRLGVRRRRPRGFATVSRLQRYQWQSKRRQVRVRGPQSGARGEAEITTSSRPPGLAGSVPSARNTCFYRGAGAVTLFCPPGPQLPTRTRPAASASTSSAATLIAACYAISNSSGELADVGRLLTLAPRRSRPSGSCATRAAAGGDRQSGVPRTPRRHITHQHKPRARQRKPGCRHAKSLGDARHSVAAARRDPLRLSRGAAAVLHSRPRHPHHHPNPHGWEGVNHLSSPQPQRGGSYTSS